jgi:hypothetical protein
VIELEQSLDTKAIQVYIDWLYTGELRIDEDIERDSDDYNVCHLGAWSVSDAVKDPKFTNAISTEHFRLIRRNGNAGFGLNSVNYAFGKEKTAEMSSFVVHVYYLNTDPDYVFTNSSWFPDNFVRDLCVMVLYARDKDVPSNNEDLLQGWLSRLDSEDI